MTDIYCENGDCIHNNNIDKCMAETVVLDWESRHCSEYKPYTSQHEYLNNYLIACGTKADGPCAKSRYGKKIVIGGEEFFTSDHPMNSPEDIYLTHGRTGFRAGSLKFVTENIEKVLEIAAQTPDVATLPRKDD